MALVYAPRAVFRDIYLATSRTAAGLVKLSGIGLAAAPPPISRTTLAGAAGTRALSVSLAFLTLRLFRFRLCRFRGLFAIFAAECDPALFERGLERAHQVDYVATTLLRRRLGDLVSRKFLLGRLDHPFSIVIVILRRCEFLLRKIRDQTLRQRELRIFDRSVNAMIDLLERSNLIFVVHRMQHQAIVMRPDQHHPFLAAHCKLRDSDPTRFRHRFLEQMVRLCRRRFASEQ